MIETERLKLRVPRISDQIFFTKLYGNPEVMKHIPPNGKPATPNEAKARLNSLITHWGRHEYGMFVVELKDAAIPVGYCGLRYLPETGDIELGYIIDQPYWGIGIASEAVKGCVQYAKTSLNIDKLIAVTNPDNLGSQKILTHIGFKPSEQNDGLYHGMIHRFFILKL